MVYSHAMAQPSLCRVSKTVDIELVGEPKSCLVTQRTQRDQVLSAFSREDEQGVWRSISLRRITSRISTAAMSAWAQRRASAISAGVFCPSDCCVQ